MIPSQFYPTTWTDTYYYGDGTFDLELATAIFPDSAYSTNFFNPYYTGWVRSENIPNIFIPTVLTIDTENNIFKSERIKVGNCDYAYFYNNTQDTPLGQTRNSFGAYMGNASFAGFNSFAPLQTWDRKQLAIRYAVKYWDISDPSNPILIPSDTYVEITKQANPTHSLDSEAFLEFLNGTLSLTINYYNPAFGGNTTQSFTINDMDETGKFEFTGTNGSYTYDLTFFIVRILPTFIQRNYYNPTGYTGNTNRTYDETASLLHLQIDGEDLIVSPPLINASYDVPTIEFYDNNGTITGLTMQNIPQFHFAINGVDYNYAFHGECEIDVSTLQRTNVTRNGDCYFIYANDSGDWRSYYVIRPMTAKEIRFFVAMFPSLNSGYQGDQYLPKIIDDEVIGEWFKAEDVATEGTEWQKSNQIADNEYTENDKPKPEDDPDSDKEVKPPLIEGDNILLQLNRTFNSFNDFITMYNITSQQLSRFGASIWTNFLDENTSSDFIKNLKYLANQTLGTYDVSQIIDLITSVRVYPFSVGTLPITTAGTNKIYIGTGKVGLDVGSQVRILSSTIGILYAGSCIVKPETPYNDFRDYYNTTVTCFLPYCGTVELNPIEVVNNEIECYYAIDFYTGECTAMLMLNSGTHSYLLAVKNGIIGVLVPITASNSSQLSARFQDDRAQDTKLVISYLSEAVNGIVSTYHSFTRTKQEKGRTVTNPDGVGGLGNIANTILGIGNNIATQQQIEANRIGRSAVLAPSLSGGSGGASFFLPDSVYLQIRRGTYSRPSNYASTCAYPNTVTKTLSDLRGLTICNNVNTNTLNCTDDEKMEIKAILESGVIL